MDAGRGSWRRNRSTRLSSSIEQLTRVRCVPGATSAGRIAELGQVVEQGDGLAGVLGQAGGGLGLGGVLVGRAGAGLGGGVLDALEQRGYRDLRGVERVVEEPLAPHVAGVAAFVPGPDEAPAGSRLDGQVDAGAELLVPVLRPVAAHVLAVADTAAKTAQRGALLWGQQVDERHGSFSGAGMARAGRVKGAVRPGCVADAGP